MTICGIKSKKNDHDVFLSIIEKNIYEGHVGTVIASDAEGKTLGELLDVFEDGSIYFIPGNDEKKISLKFDEEGRLFGYNKDGKKIVASKNTLKPVTKTCISEVTKFKSYPIVTVVDSQCSGIKSGCKKPYTISLAYSTSTCPPKTILVLKDYFNGSVLASLVDIDPSGKVGFHHGISTSYGLDVAAGGYVKVRGKFPLFGE
jgi:hypothetical protein